MVDFIIKIWSFIKSLFFKREIGRDNIDGNKNIVININIYNSPSKPEDIKSKYINKINKKVKNL